KATEWGWFPVVPRHTSWPLTTSSTRTALSATASNCPSWERARETSSAGSPGRRWSRLPMLASHTVTQVCRWALRDGQVSDPDTTKSPQREKTTQRKTSSPRRSRHTAVPVLGFHTHRYLPQAHASRGRAVSGLNAKLGGP